MAQNKPIELNYLLQQELTAFLGLVFAENECGARTFYQGFERGVGSADAGEMSSVNGQGTRQGFQLSSGDVKMASCLRAKRVVQ